MLKESTPIHCLFTESKINIELGEEGSEINVLEMFPKIAKCPNNFGQDCSFISNMKSFVVCSAIHDVPHTCGCSQRSHGLGEPRSADVHVGRYNEAVHLRQRRQGGVHGKVPQCVHPSQGTKTR